MYIRQTHSTSTLLREQYSDALPHLYTIRTDYQTAGRGQAGNSWESADGENLLFSTLLRYPDMRAGEQFGLTEVVSVAMWDMLSCHIPKEQLYIKWPNDIYYGDKKLVGILVENVLTGEKVHYSIVGIGVNVNQVEWKSSAPNPISMREIVGRLFDAEELLNQFLGILEKVSETDTETLHRIYTSHLYRRDGLFPYVEREVSIVPTSIVRKDDKGYVPFLAEIVDVSDTGELVLRKENGDVQSYHFKQIRYVI